MIGEHDGKNRVSQERVKKSLGKLRDNEGDKNKDVSGLIDFSWDLAPWHADGCLFSVSSHGHFSVHAILGVSSFSYDPGPIRLECHPHDFLTFFSLEALSSNTLRVRDSAHIKLKGTQFSP